MKCPKYGCNLKLVSKYIIYNEFFIFNKFNLIKLIESPFKGDNI